MIVEETEHLAVSGSSGILHKRSVYVNILQYLKHCRVKKKCLPFDANVSSTFEDLILHFDFDI